jgi:hypothetical protein
MLTLNHTANPRNRVSHSVNVSNNAALLLPQLHIVNCKLKIELTGACSC